MAGSLSRLGDCVLVGKAPEDELSPHSVLNPVLFAAPDRRLTSASRVVAVIPARGGSVGIPRKNVKELAGRPLIDWVIKPALHCGIFESVFVSTDDDAIAEVAELCGARVHRRHPETATSTASTESALLDFMELHADSFEVLVLIQATSPFIAPRDFVRGWELMRHTQAESVVTAVRAHRFLWSVDDDGYAHAKNYAPLARPRRQDWEGELIENG